MTSNNDRPDHNSSAGKPNDAELPLPNTPRDPKQSATEGDLVEEDAFLENNTSPTTTVEQSLGHGKE